MELLYFATIRKYTGEKGRDWNQPATTVGQLLHDLSVHYGKRFEKAVLRNGDLSPEVIVLVDGHDCRHKGGIDAPLGSVQTVCIFPMVAGGCISGVCTYVQETGRR